MIYSPNEDIVEIPILEDEAETQTLDSSARVSQSDSPIRTTEKNRYYDNTGYTWSSSYNRYTWTQDLDNRGIDGHEEVVYWFYVSSENIGAYIEADLNIDNYNTWPNEDPDLDLYLYNPSGEMVDYSVCEACWTESVSAIADSSGYWKVEVDNYEQHSGRYDLDRSFRENAAPKVVLDQIPSASYPPYVHEFWTIDACDSYDPDGWSLGYSWRIDGGVSQTGYCSKSVRFHDSNTHTISVTVSDSKGKSTTKSTTITPRAFPTSTRPMGDLTVSMDDDREPSAAKRSDTYYIDIPGTSNDVWTYLELEYKFRTTQNGEVTYSSEMVDLGDGDKWQLDMGIKDIDAEYSFEFKPEIVLNFYFVNDGQWRDLRLPVPSLVEVDSYPNQPSFDYRGQTIYYWADYVEMPLDTENDAMTFSFDERVQLSGIDLYPFVEDLIDHYSGSGYVTEFINWFADFEMPLSYNLDMQIEGDNYIDVITKIEGGYSSASGTDNAEHILQNHHINSDRLSTSMEIIRTDSILEVDQMVLLYKYVYGDVTPNLDLKFKINGVTKATIDMATWDTESFFSASRRYQSSTIHFEWEMDSDYDGVPDSIEWITCMNTDPGLSVNSNGCATNQLDSDDDGIMDDVDECPDTLVAHHLDVNSVGCSSWEIDTDDDGVVDAMDDCPETEGGYWSDVNGDGCAASERDTDGDGIVDENDRCEDTPDNGEVVDDGGCINSQLDFLDQTVSVAGTAIDMPVIISVSSIFLVSLILILFVTIRKRKTSKSENLEDSWNDEPDFSFNPMPSTDYSMAQSPPNSAPENETTSFAPIIETTPAPMQHFEPQTEFEQPMSSTPPIEDYTGEHQFVTPEPEFSMEQPNPPAQNIYAAPPSNWQGKIADDGYEWIEFEDHWHWRIPGSIEWTKLQ